MEMKCWIIENGKYRVWMPSDRDSFDLWEVRVALAEGRELPAGVEVEEMKTGE